MACVVRGTMKQAPCPPNSTFVLWPENRDFFLCLLSALNSDLQDYCTKDQFRTVLLILTVTPKRGCARPCTRKRTGDPMIRFRFAVLVAAALAAVVLRGMDRLPE